MATAVQWQRAPTLDFGQTGQARNRTVKSAPTHRSRFISHRQHIEKEVMQFKAARKGLLVPRWMNLQQESASVA